MDNKTHTSDLLSAFNKTASPEDDMLTALQAFIAAEITIKRHELGLTQKSFAEEMGVSQTLVSKWESGETNFTLKTLVLIASKLHIELTTPFKMEEPISFSDIHSNIVNLYHHRAWINSQAPIRPRHDNNDDSFEEM